MPRKEGNFTVTLTNLNEPATGAVSLTGTPVVGQTLAASNTLPIRTGWGRSLTNGTGTANRSCMNPQRSEWGGRLEKCDKRRSVDRRQACLRTDTMTTH